MDNAGDVIAFDETFELIVSKLANNNLLENLYEIQNWINILLEYNAKSGKRYRGLFVVEVYRILVNEHVCENELKLARILGWIVEIFLAAMLIMDDLMDHSITRRSKICWYKRENVGLMAINDAIIIQESNYQILEIFFSNKHYYRSLFDLIHQVSRLTSYGQYLDMSTNSKITQNKFFLFNERRYKEITKYKTAYCSFVFPVKMALYMAECYSIDELSKVENILFKIGHLYQVQDDYLDCFGDSINIGKIGTDIEDGKCCWPIIRALQLCTINQMTILKNNYGIKGIKHVKYIKILYYQLSLKTIYEHEERIYYEEINFDIDNLNTLSSLSPQIFLNILNKIYKRHL